MFLYVFLIAHNSHEHSVLFHTANFRKTAVKKERKKQSFIHSSIGVCLGLRWRTVTMWGFLLKLFNELSYRIVKEGERFLADV